MLRYATDIRKARKAGKKPAELVIVSDGDHRLHHRFPDNPVVQIDVGDRPSQHDWTFLADLEVEIATKGDLRRTLALVKAILQVRPRYLRVWWLDANMLVRITWLGVLQVQQENAFVCADAAH